MWKCLIYISTVSSYKGFVFSVGERKAKKKGIFESEVL